MPPRLWTPDAFREHERDEYLILGLSYGAMALLALYHLVLFVRLRERHLSWFAGYIGFVDLWLWLVDGVGFGQLESVLPRLGYDPFASTIWAGMVCAAMFTAAFLETKARAPRLHKALMAMAVVAVINILMRSLIDHRTTNLIGSVCFTIAYPLFIVAGFVAWRRGMRAAGLFVVAWLFYVAGAFWSVLAINGVVPFYDREYLNPFRIGIVADAIVMSLALAMRIQTIGRERAEAHAFAIAQSQLVETEKSAALGRCRASARAFRGDAKMQRHLDISADLSATIDTSSERIATLRAHRQRDRTLDDGKPLWPIPKTPQPIRMAASIAGHAHRAPRASGHTSCS